MIQRLATSREALLLGAIVVLLAVIATRFPAFITPANLANVFNDTSPLILLSIGQMIVILTRCIDLSVAANLALTGMVVSMLNVAVPGIPVPVVLVVAVGLGTLMGMFNGILVWKLDIPPIVVTLGTMTIFRGIIFLISDGKWVNSHEMSAAFKAFPRAEFLGLAMLSWMAIIAVILFYVVMTRTTLGRAVYAAGGNPHAATYTGINVGRTQFWAFTISGAIAGLTGYLWVSRYAVAYVDIAGGFELDVVAACVIGGISIAGRDRIRSGSWCLGRFFLASSRTRFQWSIFPRSGNLRFPGGHHHRGCPERAKQPGQGKDHPQICGACGMSSTSGIPTGRVIPDRLKSPLEARLKSWETLLLLVAILIFVANSFASPYFLNAWNLSDATFNFTEKAMIAFAMALLIISGEIDLSVAAIIALASTAMGAAVQMGAGTPVLILVGLGTGLLCGAFNGVLVTRLGLPSIVVTIGTMSLFRGISYIVLGDQAYGGYPSDFAFFGQGYVFWMISFEFVLFALLALVYGGASHDQFLLVVINPNNPTGALFSGIRVARVKFILFLLTGLMSGVAAICLTSRLGSTRPSIATGWELEVVTMVVLGGVNILGGSGTIPGVVIAAFVMGLVTFGLGLLNVPGIVMSIVIGALLIGVIALPRLWKMWRA